VVVVGDDFTVRGGSADASISAKPLMAEEMAHDFRLPIIRVIEGSGGGGSVKTIETKGAANLPGGIGGNRWYAYTTANMARVPVVGLGLGSVAGLGAARLAASHYSVMTRSSAMFVAGPPVVKRLGQDLSKQELGGADIQTRAGGVDHAVETEEEAFGCARRFLSYLPPSVFELPPTLACDDDPERAEESLMKAVPRSRRQVYKMRPIIDAVVDSGSFFEMSASFGRPIIAGFARLEGRAVLLLAGDPLHYGGSWTAEACQKVVRYVDLAETFHLPIVYLMDCPGFMIGLSREGGNHPHGVRAMAAVNQSTVPGAPSSCAIPSASPAWCTSPPTGFRCDMPGRRPIGVRCRWKAASKRPIAPTSMPLTIPQPSSRRSRIASTSCARRFARPRSSGSRRSSIRARRVRCCANSRGWPSRSAPPARR